MDLRIKEIPVSEENYAQTMEEKVEPFLEKYRQEGFFEGHDGNKIHYEKYIIEDASASVTIVHGFTENAEKFREMAYNFILMGFNVFVITQRGHGRSFRYVSDKQTVCVKKFGEYVADLEIFVKTIVKKDSGSLPLYVYAHSMGGAVTIQYLQTHPGVFEKAVLNAPMVLAKTAGLSPNLALTIAKLGCALGKGDKPIIGSKGFDLDKTYEQSHMTSKARFDYYQAKRCANEDYQTANPSFSWLREAVLVSRRNLNPERCARIDAKVLICQPERDDAVVSEMEDEFIKLVKDGKLVRFADSRHEIYGSGDKIVLEYLQTIEQFYKS